MKEHQYKAGLVSVSFRPHSPKEILEEMNRAGLNLIEWGSDVHAPCKDAERIGEIVALQKQYGVTCSSYGTYFRLGETPMEDLEDYIASAKRLGTGILRLWCGKKSGADMTDEEKRALVEICRQAASVAARHDVCLCMECHVKTFTERPEDALWLMQQVDSPHFQMYWQPNQYRTVEENYRSAQMLAPYTKVIHVFHWREKNKYPLADAIEDWARYLSFFDGTQALLLEFMPDGLLTTLTREAEALARIMETYHSDLRRIYQ